MLELMLPYSKNHTVIILRALLRGVANFTLCQILFDTTDTH